MPRPTRVGLAREGQHGGAGLAAQVQRRCQPAPVRRGRVMLEKARQSMEAARPALIFGRNVRKREHTESLRFVMQLKDILAKYPSG